MTPLAVEAGQNEADPRSSIEKQAIDKVTCGVSKQIQPCILRHVPGRILYNHNNHDLALNYLPNVEAHRVVIMAGRTAYLLFYSC